MSRYRPHIAKEKALVKFHAVRIAADGPIALVWHGLCSSIGVNSISPLVTQSVNRQIFEQLLLDELTAHHPKGAAVPCPDKLFSEEENVIRYMSGYVALKLMKKYKKEDYTKASQFVECLAGMAVDGPESSFYEYTKEWMKLVDRGGLFQVNESSFFIFSCT